jgi:hypothetical protein
MATLNRAEQTAGPDLGPDRGAEGSLPRSPGASSGSELKRVVDNAARRVDEIVDDAERVASGIIAEAEAEAEAYVEGRRAEVERAVEAWSADLRGVAEALGDQQSRLTKLTSSAVAELEQVAAELERIPPQLDRGGELPSGSPRGSRPGASAAPSRGSEAVELGSPADDRRGVAEDSPPSRSSSHGREKALLRAAQMAVAGSSREEIERALADELTIEDPAPIVDELLGPRS